MALLSHVQQTEMLTKVFSVCEMNAIATVSANKPESLL